MKLRLWGFLLHLLGNPRLTVRYGRNGWITLDTEDWLQRLILVGSPYEAEVWETLARFASSDETVWDVGGHVGTFAIRALTDPRVKEVRIFEPDPIHAEILERNVALNRGAHPVHRWALGDSEGEAKLYHAELPNTGRSSMAERVGPREFTVKSRTLDGLVYGEGLPPPTLLKIDVEGWEGRVLQGGERLLKSVTLKALVIEAASDEKTGELRDEPLQATMSGLGYQMRWIPRPSGEIQARENYLAVPDGRGGRAR